MKRIYLLLPVLLAAAAPAQDTDCVTRSDLADYALLSDLAAYTPLSVLAGYVTSADLAGYALLSDLAAYTPLSALAGYVTSADLAGYALLSDLAAYAPLSALDDYATTDDLANYATAADLAAACNACLPATPHTVGTTTTWHAPRTEFVAKLHATDGFEAEGDPLFNDPVSFDDDVVFNAGLVLGGETRTNWPGPREIYVEDGGTAWLANDESFVWTSSDDSNTTIYLPHITNVTGRVHTIVIRYYGSDPGGETEIYDATSAPPRLAHTLTTTNTTAVFDWCQGGDAWLLR